MKRHDISLTQFWAPPEPKNPANAGTLSQYRQRHRGAMCEAEWYGMGQNDIDSLPCQGWPEGVDKALALLEDSGIAAGATQMARRWSHDDGERFDVERYYAGLAPWQAYHRTAGGTNGRIVRLVVMAGAPWTVKAEQIAWRAFAATKAIDQLEECGYRVELVAAYACHGVFAADKTRSAPWELRVTVKEADEPVDLSQVAAVLSPAATRYYCFAWIVAEQERIGRYFGKWSNDTTETEGGDVLLPQTVDSHASAQTWLDSLEAARLGEVGHDLP